MTASEFAFLALGLMLGVAVGAAIVEVLRARPPAPRQVRVTVAPESVPRRSLTLATSAFAASDDGPARGGPADADADPQRRERQSPDAPTADREPAPVTTAASSLMHADWLSPQPGAIPIRREPDPMITALRAAETRAARVATPANPIGTARNGSPIAMPRPGTAIAGALALADPPIAPERLPSGPRVIAGPERSSPPAMDQRADGADHAEQPSTSPTSGGTSNGAPAVDPPDTTATGPCGELRRVADERCALATRSRERAETAVATLRAAQREYDDHHDRAERAAETADPRTVRTAKEDAQRRFRHAREAALQRADVEAAARDWLTEINRINQEAREATAVAARERAAANELVTSIERLTVEADAARIGAETADEACILARTAVADCEEQSLASQTARAAVDAAVAPTANAAHASELRDLGLAEGSEDEAAPLRAPASRDRDAAILRLLRGDRRSLSRIVETLAAGDPAESKRWQLAIADLLEAIVARAIEASALEFPVEHPFWGPFTRDQGRDIVGALASLGYRFDGLGGWADERVPAQRDLSLAVGYAGLDPMRIRRWPNEAEMTGLFTDVTVAADEYLVSAAGGLTLGELVSLLGRRADALTEVWNSWGRLRPLLLETDA